MKHLPSLLPLLFLVISISFSASARADSKQEIETAFGMWLKALGGGSAQKIVDLYDEDAVLLPTLSSGLVHTQAERKAYFSELTELPNLHANVHESYIRIFGDTAINSGSYTFTYTKNGKTEEIPARFSFAYVKTSKGWKIVEHHSSKDLKNFKK